MKFAQPKQSGMLLAGLIAMAAGMGVGVGGFKMPGVPTPRRIRNYPRMAVSPLSEIVAHNEAVHTRQVVRRSNMPHIKALHKEEERKAAYRHTKRLARLGRFHAA